MIGVELNRLTVLQMKRRLHVVKFRNVVVRDVRDRDGCKRGRVIEPHDGTEAGVIAAARIATDRMFAEYSTASNIESRICATDSDGKLRWAVSPNFLHLAEVGTDEASYILSGPRRADRIKS